MKDHTLYDHSSDKMSDRLVAMLLTPYSGIVEVTERKNQAVFMPDSTHIPSHSSLFRFQQAKDF